MNTHIYPYRGKLPCIHPSAFIAQTATIIGDTRVDEESGIWYGCVVRGDVNEIRIGKRTNIQDLTMIHCAELGQGCYLGDDITVGHAAVLHACSIENNAFIGIQACVMDDCIVEQGAMVAAGALVTPGKIVRANEVWAGSPAKKLRDITDQDRKFFKINRDRYLRLARHYNAEQYQIE
ncbi:MAG: gamma carbonic anhydrase family protein [Gammaproteobacteria bacterium]|nr:gamma carbonic anhydrase family protein [Gammaproteobacteria bacterium]